MQLRLYFTSMQLSEGFDETAAVCALQRAGNNMGKTREYLAAPIMREYFKEPAAVSDTIAVKALNLARTQLSLCSYAT
jgi:hypothetical protein